MPSTGITGALSSIRISSPPLPALELEQKSLMEADQSIKILPCFYEQLATQMSQSGLMQAGH
jgi:hypothetical protein